MVFFVGFIRENDISLQQYRNIRDQYGSDDYLVVTYSPADNLFSEPVLADIAELRDKLQAIDGVESVVSLLDVPLVESPPTTLFEISKQVRTLESDDADIRLAEREMTNSPLYENLLVSSEGGTTALQVNLISNEKLATLNRERDKLYQKLESIPEANTRLQELNAAIKAENRLNNERIDSTIATVRSVIDEHRQKAGIFLGGVPMIVSDSIEYIRNDLQVFGVGVLVFILGILLVSFRQPRWVFLPIAVCTVSALGMMGFLGWSSWPVTVVSSNFISLLLIITLSLIIHLIERYRELNSLNPELEQKELIAETVRSKFVPCAYTAITTMVAFGSLLVSGIRPVIDFGWMMVIGICLSFVLAFTLFPAALALMAKAKAATRKDTTAAIISSIADFIHRRPAASFSLFAVLVLIAVSGIPRLSVENRFIDYYKDHTEIYQGMTLIDEELGGTTPMDVIIDAPADALEEDDGFFSAVDITSSSYWFNSDGLEEAARIHEYLDDLPETGKVLSVHTGMQILEKLNENKPYNDFTLAVVYKRLPDDVMDALIRPYLSEDGNQLRFSIRLYESDKNLKRQQLIDRIYTELSEKFDLAPEQVTVSGMAVLYNNLLQSLFTSQILTIGAVFAAILLMFILLFRSVTLSIATIIPNMVAAGLVLGVMGWIGIPLDIMTITIAAISIGIGVDDSIHYIHRFREEFARDENHWAAIKRSHDSIGRALYYTTMTVVLGFSILVMSNFIPTIYFGVLSGLAMSTALLANLMLLPLLLAHFKLR